MLKTLFVTNLIYIKMLKKYFKGILGMLLVLFVAGSLATGCYDDSELRASINDLKSQLEQLKTLVGTLQNDDSVTGVTQNPDGSYTINFKKSGAVTIKNGEPGKNGKDGSIVTVTRDNEKHVYIFSFSDGTTLTLPQYCETRVLTFENYDYRGPEDNAKYWSSKIDDPEYGGPLLYGPDGYSWYDENNTFLFASVLPQDYEAGTYGYSNGGFAVSHYANGMVDGIGFEQQLEVFNPNLDGFGRSKSGNNLSNNFAVAFYSEYDNLYANHPLTLTMGDGVPRLVESAYFNITSYTLNFLMNGDGQTGPIADNGYLRVMVAGYNGDEFTGMVEFSLAEGKTFMETWTKVDLTSLDEVDKLEFVIFGSVDLCNNWGLAAPAYFAIDDIAVRVYPD